MNLKTNVMAITAGLVIGSASQLDAIPLLLFQDLSFDDVAAGSPAGIGGGLSVQGIQPAAPLGDNTVNFGELGKGVDTSAPNADEGLLLAGTPVNQEDQESFATAALGTVIDKVRNDLRSSGNLLHFGERFKGFSHQQLTGTVHDSVSTGGMLAMTSIGLALISKRLTMR